MTRVSTHPGAILNQEFLVPRKMSARALASRMGVPPNRVTEIINGERSVTADTAIRLGRFFKTTPEFWLELQSAHDLSVAMQVHKPLADSEEDVDAFVAAGVAFAHALRAKGSPAEGKPADKAFIDSLYE